MKQRDSAQKNQTELVKTRLSREWKRWRFFHWEPIFVIRTSLANLKFYLRQRTDPFLALIATEGQLKSKTLHPEHTFSLQPLFKFKSKTASAGVGVRYFHRSISPLRFALLVAAVLKMTPWISKACVAWPPKKQTDKQKQQRGLAIRGF